MPKRNSQKGRRGDSVRRRKQGRRRERASEPQAPAPDPEGPVRLNRYIAQAGITSRRKADDLIAEGRVRINGAVVTELGSRVEPGDRVEVDGQTISPQPFEYVLLNKPKDTITTVDDERDRQTVMDLLTDELRERGIVPVGRLDRDTTGALLITNDGELTHRLMHPRYEIEKLYLIGVDAPVKPHDLDRLRQGVELEDGPAKADQVAYVSPDQPRQIGMALHEGRNRQVRRMMEALGYRVVTLDRVRYAGLTLDGLRRGRWRRLEPHEINGLRRSVKLKPLVFRGN